jgi:nucleoid DNA-binding protein
MNKAELVNSVKSQLGDDFSKSQAEEAVNAVIDGIKKGVMEDGSVQLIGFGTFKVTERQARNGINPKTKQPIKIAASKSVKFVPGKALKEELS